VKEPTYMLQANYLEVNPDATIPPGYHMHHVELEAFRYSSSKGENLIPLSPYGHLGGYGSGSFHSCVPLRGST
jgi:hypothetical protein